MRRALQDSARDTSAFRAGLQTQMNAIRQTNAVTAEGMKRFLRDAQGDMEKATAAANRLTQGVRGIQESIVRMRAEAARRGDFKLAGLIGGADPFQGAGGAAARSIPAVARPEVAQGISRTQAAMFSLVFTIGNLGEQLAAADTKWQKLDRTIGTALQTIANTAVFFGPKGMIVAGIAAVGNFLSAFWTQQRQEVERSAREMEERIKGLIDSMDTAQQMARIQQLEMGRPSAGSSTVIAGAFAGGITDLQEQQRILERQLDNATAANNRIMQRKLREQITTLEAALRPLLDERDALTAAILNPITATPSRGASPITVSAGRTPSGADVLEQTVQRLKGMVQLEKELAGTRTFSARDAHALLAAYREVEARLAGMRDKTTEIARNMREALANAAKASGTIAIIEGRGARPGVGTTPSATGPMRPFDIKIPELERMPVTLGQQIRVALQPLVDNIKKMGQYLLQAGISMLSRYGGQAGADIGGIASGALAGFAIAGPAGAVIGGLVGVADAIFGAGQRAKESARQFREFIAAQDVFIEQQRLAAGLMTQGAFDIAQLQRAFAAQRKPLEDQLKLAEMVRKMGFSVDPAKLADLKKRIAELNDLEQKRIEQLEKEAMGLNKMTEAAERFREVPSWFKVNLEVWRAANAQMMPQQPGSGPGSRRPGPRRSATTSDSPVQIGSIVINSRATDGRQLVREWMAEMKRQGLATFGAGEEARILATF